MWFWLCSVLNIFFQTMGKDQLSYLLDNVSGLETNICQVKFLLKKIRNDRFMIWIFWNIAIQNSYRRKTNVQHSFPTQCQIVRAPNCSTILKIKTKFLQKCSHMCNPRFSPLTPNVFAKIVFSTIYQWKNWISIHIFVILFLNTIYAADSSPVNVTIDLL